MSRAERAELRSRGFHGIPACPQSTQIKRLRCSSAWVWIVRSERHREQGGCGLGFASWQHSMIYRQPRSGASGPRVRIGIATSFSRRVAKAISMSTIANMEGSGSTLD